MSKKPTQYPSFCRTDQDRASYDIAVKGKYQKHVTNPSDLLAIREGCTFEISRGEKVVSFLRLLKHSKGEWANQPFELSEWQRERIIIPLFSWVRPNGTRRFRTGLIFIPKKNGKSTLGAALALYMLIADGEPGAEVYNCGTDRANAMNVFLESASMVRKSPLLSKRCKIYEGIKRIQFGDSFYQALSSDAASAEGKNLHFLAYDELHAAATRDLWKALSGGGAARRQPLFLAITTAGSEAEGSLCFSEYKYAKGVLDGTVPDWEFFPFVAEAVVGDDPGDPKTWAKANPGLGVSPSADYLATRWRKAQGSPEDENDFKQYHLNLWVQKAESAIPLTIWDRGGEPFDPEELKGRVCFGGLDLGAVSDLTMLTLLFPMADGSIRVLAYCWCPEDRSGDRGQKKISYASWMQDGWIIKTPGNTMDHATVRRDVNRICQKYQVQVIGVDHQFQGGQLTSEMMNYDNLPIINYGNNVGTMAQPTRQLMELVLSGKLHHGGNPILRWMAGNLVMRKDANGNMMPDKAKSHQKIDGISAICMGLGVRTAAKASHSHYEDHDLLVLG